MQSHTYTLTNLSSPGPLTGEEWYTSIVLCLWRIHFFFLHQISQSLGSNVRSPLHWWLSGGLRSASHPLVPMIQWHGPGQWTGSLPFPFLYDVSRAVWGRFLIGRVVWWGVAGRDHVGPHVTGTRLRVIRQTRVRVDTGGLDKYKWKKTRQDLLINVLSVSAVCHIKQSTHIFTSYWKKRL